MRESRILCALPLVLLALATPASAAGQEREPIVYTLKVADAERQLLDVEALFPAEGRRGLELRMARWSPGFYRVEDYGARVESLSARTENGAPLGVERIRSNRWRVATEGARNVVVSYRLLCDQRSVTTNWISKELGVLNGAATFVTLVESERRPHQVRLVRPPTWKRALSALDSAHDGASDEYRAADFDTLVDSPILAGDLDVHEFEVEGSRHLLVDAGPRGAWDAQRAARDLERFVREVRAFWGFLPFKRYLFLNVFRPGGGGLEHGDSTLLTANAERVATPEGYRRWLAFVGHEYFHAFNVKRLRPVELGPFDYENEPLTTSLWMSEGITSYYAELLLARAGLKSGDELLASLSSQIEQLQKQPGRLRQTVEQSSYEVWNNSLSGVRPSAETVSYYVKGQVIGFLLDAKIRKRTSGEKSLDDFMRRAYQSYAGQRGFSPEDLRVVAAEVAGADLTEWFRKALASTEELHYEEALSWFGLRFTTRNEGAPEETRWGLAVRDDATPAQRAQMRSWLQPAAPPMPPVITAPAGSGAVEQRAQGSRPPAVLVESFDGLGSGFQGPQGEANLRQPSDNTLAVGPDHIVQIVNSRTAIFTKRGKRFSTSGKVLYGPMPTNNVFRGFGGQCEARNNGDAVVRYDQLAGRWLIVMPVFARGPVRQDQPGPWTASERAYTSPAGRPGQPGPAVPLFQPPSPPPSPSPAPSPRPRGADGPQGPWSMCYAVSVGPDPFGPYYRYEFLRPLFPDYPRPAVWRDGYYVATSTGDDVVQKHACIVERARLLKGEPATEQCLVIDGVNFLNNADVEGKRPPPAGAPNVMMAAGGAQLKGILEDDAILAWKLHVDWKDPAKSKAVGPERIAVAPYRYLCDGQLTHCVPQPGSDRRLDAQGDKIMPRLVYRKTSGRESMVAVHSVNTTAGGGGVRWYEFEIDKERKVALRQQGTYAADGLYRWMASPAIDRSGNIGIGFSFGGASDFAGQRFAGRLANDSLGVLTLREAVLTEGQAAQTAMRWEDYTQTAVDPSDDCTIWYVGDYLEKDAGSYSTRIGAFRLPGCPR